MTLELIAKFSLIDENKKHIADVEIGKELNNEDLQYSLKEQYVELKSRVEKQTPQYKIIDFAPKKVIKSLEELNT